MGIKYLPNRLKYHAASRVAAKEADPLLNAMNFDGHTVPFNDVWAGSADEFPKNTSNNTSGQFYHVDGLTDNFNFKTTTDGLSATKNLVKVFTNNFTTGNGVSQTSFRNGTIWTNTLYPTVKLFYQVEMTGVQYSNGDASHYEAYEILDASGNRYQDWVSPTAIFDTELNRPIPGYTGIVEIYKESTWSVAQQAEPDYSLDAGNWEFMYPAGIVTFARGLTPTNKGYSKVRWTGFLYNGIYLNKKIANVFAGITLPVSTNLDTFTTVGIHRITNSIQGTKPPITDVTGFLQVMDIDHDEDRTANATLRRIRQIVYPDNTNESTPYSRVGSANTLTGAITWSEWTQMGGNSLRRVIVNGSTTAQTVSTQNNVMYESWGNNTFNMPSAASVPVGTRIGVEQYSGTSTIKCGNNGSEWTKQLAADTPDPSYGSSPAATAVSYVFECVLSSDNSTRVWSLDIDHNYAKAVNTLKENIEQAKTALNASITALREKHDHEILTIDGSINTINEERINDQTVVSVLRSRQTKYTTATSFTAVVPSTAQLNNASWVSNNSATNLYFYDFITTVTSNNVTVTLPDVASDVYLGAKITVELLNGVTGCVVKIGSNGTSETFSNTSGSILVLEFEFTKTSSSTKTWTLLSIA